MAKVSDLKPGDLVSSGDTTALYVTRCWHPLYPRLAMVIWRLGDRWSFDALELRQEVGDVVSSTAGEREQRLRAVLLGEVGAGG